MIKFTKKEKDYHVKKALLQSDMLDKLATAICDNYNSTVTENKDLKLNEIALNNYIC